MSTIISRAEEKCGAAAPAAVEEACRLHRRGQDALATAGTMPALPDRSRTAITRWLCIGLLILAIGPGAKTLRAQEMTLELDPAKTRIEFTLGAALHTVHGTCALKRGTIHFNLSAGSASGIVIADVPAATAETKGATTNCIRKFSKASATPRLLSLP